MAEQDRKTKKRTDAPQRDDQAPAGNPAVAERGAKLKKTIDEVLEDIDEVLEENAEEFVKSYVQRGGE